MITKDAKCRKEVGIRIAMAKQALIKYERNFYDQRKQTRILKNKMVKSIVWSVLLYGSDFAGRGHKKTKSVRKVNIEEMRKN